MNDYVGVTSWYAGNIVNELKKAAIVFDRIATRHLHSDYECERFSKSKNGVETRRAFDLLASKGITIRVPDIDFDNADKWLGGNDQLVDAFKGIEGPSFLGGLQAVLRGLLRESPDTIETQESYERFEKDANPLGFVKKDLFVRLATLQMRKMDGLNAMPIISQFDMERCINNSLDVASEQDIIRVVYDKIPLPNYTTPWEAIFEFREDQEGKGKLRKLKSWIKRTSKIGYSLSEANDELNDTLNDYSNYMEIQHKKISLSKMETAIVMPVEILENMLKLKPSAALKMFFQAKKEKIQILEAEMVAPGRELATLFDARNLTASKRRKKWKFW